MQSARLMVWHLNANDDDRHISLSESLAVFSAERVVDALSQQSGSSQTQCCRGFCFETHFWVSKYDLLFTANE